MTLPTADLTQLDGLVLAGSHAGRRLSLEQHHEERLDSGRQRLLNIERPGLIRRCLQLVGLHTRGQNNARQILLRQHRFAFPQLPAAFKGFRILHLSDLHLDMDTATSAAIIEKVRGLDYDICVMTGDYRARTYGSCDAAMEILGELRAAIPSEIYAVLGNHDSIVMVSAMEAMNIQVLMNSGVRLQRGGHSIGLGGIDDAHYFRLHDIAAARVAVEAEPVKILLSHTPEVFSEAADLGFDAFLCGHTHGGQICLPGGVALTLESRCPRSLGKGAWQYQGMQGYTSVGAGTSIVNVRFNCPPEITIHTLDDSDA